MEIIKKISVDMGFSGMPPHVDAVQGESFSRIVEITTLNGGAIWTGGDGSVSIAYKKPDGTSGWYDTLPNGDRAVTTSSDSVFNAVLAPAMLTVPGVVYALMRFDYEGKILATFPFAVRVAENPSFGSVKSENYYNVQNWEEANTNIEQILERLKVLEESGSGGGPGIPAAAVLYTEQSLDDSQQSQARANIGAAKYGETLLVFKDEHNEHVSEVSVEADYPITDDSEKMVAGRVSFYERSGDLPCVLGNIADGERDADAATVGQLRNAVGGGAAKYITANKFMVGENVLTADKIGTAANWTVSGNTFTHASGSTEPLRIALGDLAVAGDEWLITFDSPDITGDVLYLSFGTEAKTQTYNGLTSIAVAVRVKENGDDLLITPISGFNGTLSNFQIRKISEDGTELYEFESDSLVNMDSQIAKTGFWNVVLGTEHTMTNALNSSRTIAIGHNALHSLRSGNRNIGIGTFAMQQMNDGEDNLAIGADSMGYLNWAKRCTAFGVKSLVGYTESIVDAVAIGTGAGYRGNQLTAVGSNAGCANQGDDNTFIGCRAGANNTTGSRNIIIGSYTEGQAAGMFNVIIGRNADYPNNANNCIAIGKNAKATKSNQVVIGSAETAEIVLGNKKLIFNDDGTVTWEALT